MSALGAEFGIHLDPDESMLPQSTKQAPSAVATVMAGATAADDGARTVAQVSLAAFTTMQNLTESHNKTLRESVQTIVTAIGGIGGTAVTHPDLTIQQVSVDTPPPEHMLLQEMASIDDHVHDGWKCKRHAQGKHDIFVSYRVNSEKHLAEKIFLYLDHEVGGVFLVNARPHDPKASHAHI